jgi:hypothetical protein
MALDSPRLLKDFSMRLLTFPEGGSHTFQGAFQWVVILAKDYTSLHFGWAFSVYCPWHLLSYEIMLGTTGGQGLCYFPAQGVYD